MGEGGEGGNGHGTGRERVYATEGEMAWRLWLLLAGLAEDGREG